MPRLARVSCSTSVIIRYSIGTGESNKVRYEKMIRACERNLLTFTQMKVCGSRKVQFGILKKKKMKKHRRAEGALSRVKIETPTCVVVVDYSVQDPLEDR